MSSERFVTAAPLPEAQDLTRRYVDLAQPRLGSSFNSVTHRSSTN